MVIQILFLSVIIPLVLSSILQVVMAGSGRIREPQQWNAISLFWVAIFFIIAGVSAFIPSQSVEWLWLFVVAFFVLDLFSFKYKSLVATGLFLLFLLVFFWPVLSYKPEIKTHWLLFTELLFVFIAASVVNFGKPQSTKLALLASAGFPMLLGIYALLSGSLLLALLCLSLGFFVTPFFLYKILSARSSIYYSSFFLVNLIMLSLIRVYADGSLYTAAALYFALIIIYFLERLKNTGVVLAGLLMSGGIAWSAYQELINTASYY